jgi:hypothetical protein
MESLDWIQHALSAQRVRRGARLQSLWGGYGEIVRLELEGARFASAILKHVDPPGGEAGLSHARKCRSYAVEQTFYRDFAPSCDAACRVPQMLASASSEAHWNLVLEDLDASGFSSRFSERGRGSADAIVRVLAWLAAFHARFLGVAPRGLWPTGTYWHLATRPDELAAIEDEALRAAAPVLDERLRGAAFQTLVHGDAKLANFCFSPGSRAVAAVDFQYVGGGSGMVDVAYLLYGRDVGEDFERQMLDEYFVLFRAAVARRSDAGRYGVSLIEAEWRALYPLACADFYRFLAGWAAPHFRSDRRAQARLREILRAL